MIGDRKTCAKPLCIRPRRMQERRGGFHPIGKFCEKHRPAIAWGSRQARMFLAMHPLTEADKLEYEQLYGTTDD